MRTNIRWGTSNKQALERRSTCELTYTCFNGKLMELVQNRVQLWTFLLWLINWSAVRSDVQLQCLRIKELIRI
jgi:hypothetical protein